MSSVTIVYPNARRVQIKIQPTTKVLEIIEEACKRQGLESDEHTLRYQKRTLDTTLTFRMTGIANNTTLDLEKMDVARKFKDVTLVLQLSDGSKLTPKNFKPDITTFEQVLCAYQAESELLQSILARQEADLYPTCSFMNEQVVGDYQLRNTTLKDMGLLNGRVLIRVDSLKLEKDAFEKRHLDFEQKLEKKLRLDRIYEEKKLEENAQVKKMEEKVEKVVEARNGNNDPTHVIIKPEIQSIQTSSKDIIDIIEKPVAKEFSNFKFADRKQPLKIAEKQPVEPLEKKIEVNEFAAFKFPEATKGKVCNDLGEMFEMEKESREACDRQAVLVNMDVVATRGANEAESMDTDNNGDDLPEDVFDLTLQDLKSMLGSLKKAQNEESVMMTKQMREQEQDLKALKYPNTAIRVCFKNRTYLQGIFRPKETAAALYKFVADNIKLDDNSPDDLDFVLYTSPPRKDIKDMKKTLFEHQLCPAAQIYFKNKSDRMPKLSDEIKSVSSTEAQQIVYVTIHQNTRQVEDEGLTWLKKEQTAASKILKTSSMASNILGQNVARTSNSGQSQSHHASSSSEDPAKRKMGSLFLGKKK